MEYELTWGLPVVWYLFLAGVGAGAVTVSGLVLLGGAAYNNRDHANFKLSRYGALIGPLPVMFGCFLLVFELGRWDRALNLYKVINLSPMSIGSWFLLFIIFSLIYAVAFIPSLFPQLDRFAKRMSPVLHVMAWVNIPLGIGVAVYTGILLGAMPSRPLWNSPILAMLFLISALSTGVATIILARTLFHGRTPSDEPDRRKQTRRIATLLRPGRRFYETSYILTSADIVLIAFEILIIFLFIMFAHLTVGNLKYAIAIILPGGEMAGMFWVWVVMVGLAIPWLLEMSYVTPKVVYQRNFMIHESAEILISVAVLIGGFMLRYIVVFAGQITGPMGI